MLKNWTFMHIPSKNECLQKTLIKLNMSCLMEDNELLEKYEIWKKLRNDIKDKFDSETAYNEK